MLSNNEIEVPSHVPLSTKEYLVCRLALENPTEPYKNLAFRAQIAEKTFNVHMVSIFRKLGVHSRQQLFSKFITSGKVPDDLLLNRVLRQVTELERAVSSINSAILDLRSTLDDLLQMRIKDAGEIRQAV